MATSKIAVTEGSGANIATHSISEDAVTKQIQRVTLSNSSGTDIGPLSESDFDTKIGSLTEAAPASDTASSGVNGRLQRIAQRITSLIALVPAALTASGNFKVAVQEALPAGTNNIGDVDITSIAAGTNNIGDVDIASIAAGDNNIGNVDVLTLPADPLGANADAAATAGSTGSISAKLRLITSQLDSIKTAVETLDNVVSGSEAQVDIVAALPAGTNTIGKVNVLPETTGGLSIFRSLDLDETEEEVKASAGQVYGMWITNTATSTRFVKFYNATAANVTVGTTTPVITVAIPGNSSDDVTGLFGGTHGIAFDTAITVAATTAVADNDTGAPGVNEVIINVFYK